MTTTTTEPDTFTCLDCKGTKITHHQGGTGYATLPDGGKICYACSDKREIEHLKTATTFLGYVSSDGRNLTTWPGGILGTVSFGRLHHWSRERYHVRAYDLHGNAWHGTGARGMYCTLRRCK